MADRRQQLIDAVTALVDARYGGNWQIAWINYDDDADEKISARELSRLLKDAGIGSDWTRGMWGREIMRVMDRDQNGKLSYDEFRKAIEGT
jgi:Ca2+-binding EF-hand superfamily protein